MIEAARIVQPRPVAAGEPVQRFGGRLDRTDHRLQVLGWTPDTFEEMERLDVSVA